MKTINVSYGGFETEQSVDECLYDAIYNKAINDFAELLREKRDKRTMKVGCDDLELRKIAKQLKEGGENERM